MGKASIFIILASAVSIGSAFLAFKSPADSFLGLSELSSRPLPDSLPISKATIDGFGRVLLWSGEADRLLIASETELKKVAVPSDGELINIRSLGLDELELLVAGPPRRGRMLFGLNSTDSISFKTLPVPLQVRQAVFADQHWWVAGPDEKTDKWTLLRIASARSPASAPVHLDIPPTADLLCAAIGQRRLAFSTRQPPIQIGIIDYSGDVLAESRLGAAELTVFANPQVATEALWHVFALFPIRQHIVLSLADLRSFRRALVFFDSSLRARGRIVYDAPLVFMAADLERDIVYGVRHIDQPELVTFKITRENVDP